MGSNFPNPTHGNLVQGALTLEPGKAPLDGLSLLIQSLPFRGAFCSLSLCPQPFVSLVGLNNGDTEILLPYQPSQRHTRVSLVSQDKARLKIGRSFTGLSENVRGSLGVMDVASTHISRNRVFILSACKEMELKAVDGLFDALGSLLNAPPCVFIRFCGLTTVAPSLQGSAIEGDPLTKPRQSVIAPLNQGTRNIFELGGYLIAGQLEEESRKGTFVRDLVSGRDATGVADVRILQKLSDKGVRRVLPHDVLGNEASKKDFDGVTSGTRADRAAKGLNERLIVQHFKGLLKPLNDGWRLFCCASGDNISKGHGKLNPSCWLGDSGSGSAWVSVLIRTSVLLILSIINRTSTGPASQRHRKGSPFR